MKQVVKIIRKVDIEKQYAHILKLELDYELASLFSALQENDAQEIDRSKKRLQEIQQELQGIQQYV